MITAVVVAIRQALKILAEDVGPAFDTVIHVADTLQDKSQKSRIKKLLSDALAVKFLKDEQSLQLGQYAKLLASQKGFEAKKAWEEICKQANTLVAEIEALKQTVSIDVAALIAQNQFESAGRLSALLDQQRIVYSELAGSPPPNDHDAVIQLKNDLDTLIEKVTDLERKINGTLQ